MPIVNQPMPDSTARSANPAEVVAFPSARSQSELTHGGRRKWFLGIALNLDYTNIISPVSGTVVSRNVTTGQTVAASFQTPTPFLIAADFETGLDDDSFTEITGGELKPGDEVITGEQTAGSAAPNRSTSLRFG